MKLLLILHIAAEYLVILPGMLLCFLPVTKWLRLPPAKLYPLYIASLILVCLVLGCLNADNPNYYENLFFLPLMLVFMIIYFGTVRLEKLKLLYLFLCAAAALSFGALAGSMTEAALYPQSDIYKLSDYGLIVQFIISFLFLGAFFLFRKKIAWIFENLHSKAVWRSVWTVPALIAFSNFMMEPLEYYNVWVGRIFLLYFIMEIVLLYLFIFFQFMFYQIAKTSYEKYMSEKTTLIYQIQGTQYEALKNHMEQTRGMRHDFKHVMMTVGELIQKEKYDEVKVYTEHYYKAVLNKSMQYSFCKNAAVNAILSYFTNIAADAGIQTKFQVGLPDKTNISDIDLSIVFSNLLENAVMAAKAVQPEKRYIRLTADTNTPNSLYIVMTNSFGASDKKYSQLNTKGNAAGLSSIRSIAEKYHGVAEFYEDKGEFVSNVMLELKKCDINF